MPYFLCRLAAEDGRLLTQSILAPSRMECRKRFESEGFFILSVKKDWAKIPVHFSFFGKKIPDKDFILFNQELMALIRAGYPVLKSLENIAGRVTNIHLKELLIKIQAEIQAGKSLSEAFGPFEKDFGKIYTASLLAGEQSGNMAGSLGRYIQYAKIISQTRSKIKSALIYPSLLLAVSIILLSILIVFVLPRFSNFYKDFGAKMPAVSRMLISFSMTISRIFPYLILLSILAVLAVFRMKRHEKGAVTIDRLKLFFPYVRRFMSEMSVAMFSRTLGLLLEGGIPLLQSAGIAIQAVSNKHLNRRLINLQDGIRNGESLSESLSRTAFFPPLALDMIRVGETSANLSGMLGETADLYDDHIQARIGTLVSLIEPVIIIFAGILAAIMLLAVYVPIFNAIQIVR